MPSVAMAALHIQLQTEQHGGLHPQGIIFFLVSSHPSVALSAAVPRRQRSMLGTVPGGCFPQLLRCAGCGLLLFMRGGREKCNQQETCQGDILNHHLSQSVHLLLSLYPFATASSTAALLLPVLPVLCCKEKNGRLLVYHFKDSFFFFFFFFFF